VAGDMIDELVVGVRFALNDGSEKRAKGAVSALQQEIDRLTASFPKKGEWEDTLALPEPELAPWEALAGTIATIGVVGASALGALVVSTVRAGAAAEVMGIRFHLGAEDVQLLGYVAERSGVEIGDLASGLNTLTMQLGAAQKGSADAAGAFAALGLDAADYADGTAALGDVADALDAIPDRAQRTRLEMQLFGESGGKLGELLGRGSKGIQELQDHAAALGFVISDTDAAISRHLVGSVDDLGKIATGVGRKIGLALVPALDEAASSTVDWYVANHDIIDQQLDRVTDGISTALEYMLTPLGLATTGVLGFAAAWGSAGAAKAMAQAVGEASPLAAAIGTQAKNLGAATLALGPYAIAAAAVGLTLDDLNKAAEGADSVILRLAGTIGVEGETQAALKSIKTLIGETAGLAWDLGAALTDGIGDALDDLAAKLPEIAPLLDAIKEIIGFSPGDALTAVAGAAQSGISTIAETRNEVRQGNYVDAYETFSRGFVPGAEIGASYRESGGASINVGGVVVQVADPAKAARDAGAALERQILDALAAIPGN
jgi:hypothetical protein